MKKIFTLVAMAMLGMGTACAQNGVVELSWDTMLKNETGDNTADQSNIKFLDANGNETGFILKPAGGRTQAVTEREGCAKVLNFKNNTNQELVIPEGTKVYKINFYGWSQGDNWTYLYAYGPTVKEWEWTDPIGGGIQDNTKIIDEAKYPLDPCIVNEANVKQSSTGVYETTCFHNAGYCFASIDFSDEPYEGSFCFVFNGNNQERAWMVVYTSKDAAAAAPAAVLRAWVRTRARQISTPQVSTHPQWSRSHPMMPSTTWPASVSTLLTKVWSSRTDKNM